MEGQRRRSKGKNFGGTFLADEKSVISLLKKLCCGEVSINETSTLH